jgi:hypothetical protein
VLDAAVSIRRARRSKPMAVRNNGAKSNVVMGYLLLQQGHSALAAHPGRPGSVLETPYGRSEHY